MLFRSKNTNQIPKKIFSEKATGENIKVLQVYSDIEEGQVVANHIADFNHENQYKFQDIAVLYRTNAQSRVMEDQLRKNYIPYRIYGGLSFYQRKEIKDVIAYGRLIVNPNDEEALKRIINYPIRGIGDTTLNKLLECASLQAVSAWEVLNNPLQYNLPVNTGTAKKLSAFAEMIKVYMGQSDVLDAYQLTELIIKSTGMLSDTYVDRSPENLSRQENVQELLNAIHAFCDVRTSDGESALLVDFLAEVSLLTDQDTDKDSDKDKVTLMTVHAAKGLEFKVVFIVGMEEELFPSLFSMESSRELEEERRLFYVAITRAEERCFISYAKSRFKNGKINFANPSRFIKDIDPIYLDQPAESPFENRKSVFDDDYDSDFGFSSGYRKPVIQSTKPSGPSAIWNESQATQKKLTKITRQETPATSSTASLPVGSRVKHQLFGEGKVLAISMAGANEKAEIDFGSKGIKTLLLKFTRLEILQ